MSLSEIQTGDPDEHGDSDDPDDPDENGVP